MVTLGTTWITKIFSKGDDIRRAFCLSYKLNLPHQITANSFFLLYILLLLGQPTNFNIKKRILLEGHALIHFLLLNKVRLLSIQFLSLSSLIQHSGRMFSRAQKCCCWFLTVWLTGCYYHVRGGGAGVSDEPHRIIKSRIQLAAASYVCLYASWKTINSIFLSWICLTDSVLLNNFREKKHIWMILRKVWNKL